MNSISENAISRIKDYEGYIEFMSQYRGYSFCELSYIRWTIREILQIVQKWDDIPPLTLMENFQTTVQQYSEMNQKTRYIFSIMNNTTQDIIDYLIST